MSFITDQIIYYNKIEIVFAFKIQINFYFEISRVFDISVFDITGFFIISYIVKMARTTDVPRDFHGIRDIGVRDTEV